MKRIANVVPVLATVALAAFLVSASQAGASTVSASGGVIKFAAALKDATSCTWSASPRIAGFDATVKCGPGRVARSATLGANTSGSSRHFLVSLTVKGPAKKVERWKVVQAAAVRRSTTTTAPATSVLWKMKGSGDQSGPQFTVPSTATGWSEEWSYDCSRFGLEGNFITDITGYASASLTTDTGSSQLGMGGAGVNYHYDTGTFSIQVISECDWTETVVAVGASGTTTTSTVPSASVLWTMSGSGDQSGPEFTVPSTATGWNEEWSFDCSNFGSVGNFITDITGFGSASITTDAGASQLGTSGAGANYHYDTGTFSIQVISECDWTETVVAVGG
jgi:hypothetical protein